MAELRYLTARRAEDGRIVLHAATPSGQDRSIPLTDPQAVVLIRDLASMLFITVQRGGSGE